MGDEAHVGLVDAHAERDGRDHDDAVFAQEPRLVARARRGVEPRVVRQRLDALGDERVGGLLDRRARQAVDDAGVAGVLGAQQRQQLRSGWSLASMRYWMLGRSKLATNCCASVSCNRRQDLAPRGVGRRRGERDARHGRPALVQHRELQVVGPEVVAPLRDAVRLVDREQRERARGRAARASTRA